MLVLATPLASGQSAPLHADFGAEFGAIERTRTQAGPSAPTPLPGSVAEVHGHVALLPMVRAGLYLAYDLGPASSGPLRHLAEAGVRLKVAPPLFRAPWHGWAFAGLGYGAAVRPSYVARGQPVEGAGGGLLDVPVGVGIGVRVRRPLVLFAEVAGRFGLAFTGSLYDASRCSCSATFAGKDSFAASLSVGVSWGD